MLTRNPQATFSPYPADLQQIMNVHKAGESRVWLSSWKMLRPSATPLWSLPDLASRLGLGGLSVKDESMRSPLGSFKALGAPIALVRLILRLFPSLSFDAQRLLAGDYESQLDNFTVISATDGNHGRALAAAAQSVGCRCVIVLHAHVSQEREQAIAGYGAKIVRISGNYDASVTEAARLAAENGWQVVSDTSYDGYEIIPCDVMQGYGIIAAEIVEQAGNGAFTHVFLQGGVGGLAAGIASYFWEIDRSGRPTFIVVEPQQADCLYQSALRGEAANATSSVDSVMAGLACGETSPLAWRFLQPGVDWFMTVDDSDAVAAMRTLAAGSERDIPIVSGESGAAGLAGLSALCRDPRLAEQVGLNAGSRVLLISTEGDTAPGVYQELTGESGQSVRSRQSAWRPDKRCAECLHDQ
ncbi:diaminopropionate ammonia-lyase [Metapseudomonas boanensis]|uniref:Diaminopropionate ammonia-lyase n=1 Tax=Metapseudomonas boanensis TaxID=2822138 RepID=A0ABS5XH26_9GAMM|nr:diaminopropionate ammonia-lyase [Pseudomonas boanensis]MBT8766987.1 diaminopropionate ammonia-lyase [Pseudomonas boanensis]